MTAAETLKKVEATLAELNIRMSGVGGGGAVNHNLLSATHPDTDPDSPVRGDIVVGIAGPEWQRYAIGVAGTFLRSDGNDPLWAGIGVPDLPAHAAEHEVGGGDLVDHDLLGGLSANEHIDHTAVTLTAGEGLQGGGTIAANRTFALDINGLVEDAAGTSGDFFVYYDTVAGDHKKIDWDDMPGGGASPWTVDVNDIYWDGIGHVTIGAIAPDTKMTVAGFNIYTPATADTLHFAIQNADVAHGFTNYANADTYLAIQKNNSAAGGAWIAGFSDATTQGMRLWGLSNQAPAGFSTASVACLDFAAAERSGGGGVKMADTDNAFAWINWTTTIMLLKGRGDLCFPDSQCRILLGDSINTFMDSGITINQKGYDNEIFAFKGSDINHGMTTKTEYDTYMYMKKRSANIGGVQIVGLSEVTIGVELAGGGDTDNILLTSAAIAPIILNAIKKSGSTFGAVGANGNLVVVRNNDDSVLGIKTGGETWQLSFVTQGGGGVDGALGVIRYPANASYMTTYRHKEEVSVSGTAANNRWLFSICDGTAAGFTLVFGIFGQYFSIFNIRSGANQAAAGAAANELWKTNGHATLPDNVVMIGV